MPGLLLPLWVVLMMLGSNLGLTDEQTADKYVYFATTDATEIVLTGVACRDEWMPLVGPEYAAPCAGLPSNTAVLFPLGWSAGPERIAYLVRHEVEHLLRGPDGPAEDVWNEAAATGAGCAASWDTGFCW
jgi:hypothetical protein